MAADRTRQLVVFSLGTERYGLAIETVVEIIRHTEPRSIAANASAVRGVIGLRGQIITIFDLAAHLELPPRACTDGKIVIVDAGFGQVGLMVDEVDEVLTVEEDCLERVPVTSSAGIQSIARVDDQLVMVLAVDVILSGVER
jgi:purine-binding chemotaxis protein CheW